VTCAVTLVLLARELLQKSSMSPNTTPLLVASLLATAVGCGGPTQGARPHDMSVASHETTAAHEQGAAASHESQYNPEAAERRERCRGGGTGAQRTGLDACWTSVTNPTTEHLREADEHKKAAAEHRAAAQALRDAESRACGGVPNADRDESPFDHKEDIENVEPLYVGSSSGKSSTKRLEGAIVTFRALPGMTAQWLQRVVDCHLARNSALGHQVPEMAYCPLVPKGVSATVTGTQTGFAVAIRSDDPDTAQEVLRRARALAPSHAK
jgi:hypothetical protein